jgi:hypothetical protein
MLVTYSCDHQGNSAMIRIFALAFAFLLPAACTPPTGATSGGSVLAARLQRVDAAIEAAIAANEIPGAVALVAKGGRTT